MANTEGKEKGQTPSWDPMGGFEIQPEDLVKASSDGENFRLVDCREEDEFAICNLGGAELIPLSHFGAMAEVRIPEKHEFVAIYCHHGVRSVQATAFLRSKGYENVFSVAGGIDRWSQEIDPTVPRY